MWLQLFQAAFGAFIIVCFIAIFYLVTRRNLLEAKKLMTKWRDDYWFRFITPSAGPRESRYKFLYENMDLTGDDADIFMKYQSKWYAELATSLIVLFATIGICVDWLNIRLLK
jgi:hypothetical protein